jgi:hypothetical protein
MRAGDEFLVADAQGRGVFGRVNIDLRCHQPMLGHGVQYYQPEA